MTPVIKQLRDSIAYFENAIDKAELEGDDDYIEWADSYRLALLTRLRGELRARDREYS